MRLLRISLAIFSLFILILALAVLTLMFFLDPNKLKPVITQVVMQRTGYELLIDGNLSWSFYPRPSVKIAHMTLNAPKQSKPFLDLRDVKIAVPLTQILSGKEKLGGKIYISTMQLMNINLQNLSTDLQWQNNILSLQAIKASLYDGTLQGVAQGSKFSSTPHWEWDVNLKQVQLQTLLKDLSQSDSKLRLSGLGQVDFKASTDGKTKAQLLAHLNGDSDFLLSQGVVEGINLNYFVQAADAIIQKQAITAPTDLNQTYFESLKASISIKDGIATTKEFKLVSPAFVSHGEGSLTLASEAINFQLQVKPQRSNPSLDIKNWEIPVLVTGSLKQPNVRLNLDEAQKAAVNQEVDKIKTKARTILKERVIGKAGDLLQNLLGN